MDSTSSVKENISNEMKNIWTHNWWN